MKPIVLASRSPARAQMLRDAGLTVQVRPPAMDEDAAKPALAALDLDPFALAGRLAEAKARAVTAASGEIVLGADQTLDLDGETFNKPRDLDDLGAQLARLQGRSHRLHSAAVLVRDGAVLWTGVSSVTLAMRPLEASEIAQYVDAEGPSVLGCVGGYRLEGRGVQLFEAIKGEYFAVLGLPLLALLAALRSLER